jgi:hypothetical protein
MSVNSSIIAYIRYHGNICTELLAGTERGRSLKRAVALRRMRTATACRNIDEIYEVRCWDGLSCHDIYTTFHKVWLSHSIEVKFRSSSFGVDRPSSYAFIWCKDCFKLSCYFICMSTVATNWLTKLFQSIFRLCVVGKRNNSLSNIWTIKRTKYIVRVLRALEGLVE